MHLPAKQLGQIWGGTRLSERCSTPQCHHRHLSHQPRGQGTSSREGGASPLQDWGGTTGGSAPSESPFEANKSPRRQIPALIPFGLPPFLPAAECRNLTSAAFMRGLGNGPGRGWGHWGGGAQPPPPPCPRPALVAGVLAWLQRGRPHYKHTQVPPCSSCPPAHSHPHICWGGGWNQASPASPSSP